jgi:hypothetical protein
LANFFTDLAFARWTAFIRRRIASICAIVFFKSGSVAIGGRVAMAHRPLSESSLVNGAKSKAISD